MATQDALHISERDNVAVALRSLLCGHGVTAGAHSVVLTEDVPAYHKFALKDIEAGEQVLKYGECIGEATQRIAAGGYVHTHNVKSLRG